MKLALGTVQFGMHYGIANQNGQVSPDEARKIIETARVNGIDTLDTAIAYGVSEACLGKIGVSDFKIITKLPVIPEHVKDVHDWVHEQVHASLHRLGVKSIYGLLLHRPQQLIGAEGIAVLESLLKLKSDGHVQKIGVSIYSPDELDVVTNICKVDLVQSPFSIVDQRLNNTGWLQRLYDSGVEVHARSVFLQGLLLMCKENIPVKFKSWFHIFNAWQDWLNDNHFSPVQACIGFVQRFSQISRVVVGVESSQQLIQVVNASRESIHCNFPELSSVDEMLINPARWSTL